MLEKLPLQTFSRTSSDLINFIQENKYLAGGISAIGLCSYGVYVYLFKDKSSKAPPGPRGLPILGNALLMMRIPCLYKWVEENRGTYGDIIKLKFGTMKLVFLNNMKLVHEAFITQQELISDRLMLPSFEAFLGGASSVTFGNPTPKWKLQRKIVHESIRKYASGKQLSEIVDSCVNQFIDHVKSNRNELLDPEQMMNTLIYNELSSVAFGVKYKFDDPDFVKNIKYLQELTDLFGDGFASDYFPILRYFPSPSYKKAQRIFKEFREDLIDQHVRHHRDTFDPDHIRDLMDFLLKCEKEELEGNPQTTLTTEDFGQIILDIFFAGTDTTRLTMAWGLGFLAKHPEIQQKMRSEIETVIGSSVMEHHHKSDLNYCNAMVHELMRIRPLAPLGLPHQVKSDVVVAGYKIEKGTQVMPNIWALHMDPKIWENPQEFKPERFLDSEGKFQSHQGWMPFSTGKRVCPGEVLAKLHVLMFMVSIVQRCHVKAPPGVKITCDMKNVSLGLLPVPFKLAIDPIE